MAGPMHYKGQALDIRCSREQGAMSNRRRATRGNIRFTATHLGTCGENQSNCVQITQRDSKIWPWILKGKRSYSLSFGEYLLCNTART